MLSRLSSRDRTRLARVKALPRSVCDAPPPSEAHHIRQGLHHIAVALCVECHRSPVLGWHGQKRAWAVRKVDELDAPDVTIRRLL